MAVPTLSELQPKPEPKRISRRQFLKAAGTLAAGGGPVVEVAAAFITANPDTNYSAPAAQEAREAIVQPQAQNKLEVSKRLSMFEGTETPLAVDFNGKSFRFGALESAMLIFTDDNSIVTAINGRNDKKEGPISQKDWLNAVYIGLIGERSRILFIAPEGKRNKMEEPGQQMPASIKVDNETREILAAYSTARYTRDASSLSALVRNGGKQITQEYHDKRQARMNSFSFLPSLLKAKLEQQSSTDQTEGYLFGWRANMVAANLDITHQQVEAVPIPWGTQDGATQFNPKILGNYVFFIESNFTYDQTSIIAAQFAPTGAGGIKFANHDEEKDELTNPDNVLPLPSGTQIIDLAPVQIIGQNGEKYYGVAYTTYEDTRDKGLQYKFNFAQFDPNNGFNRAVAGINTDHIVADLEAAVYTDGTKAALVTLESEGVYSPLQVFARFLTLNEEGDTGEKRIVVKEPMLISNPNTDIDLLPNLQVCFTADNILAVTATARRPLQDGGGGFLHLYLKDLKGRGRQITKSTEQFNHAIAITNVPPISGGFAIMPLPRNTTAIQFLSLDAHFIHPNSPVVSEDDLGDFNPEDYKQRGLELYRLESWLSTQQ